MIDHYLLKDGRRLRKPKPKDYAKKDKYGRSQISDDVLWRQTIPFAQVFFSSQKKEMEAKLTFVSGWRNESSSNVKKIKAHLEIIFPIKKRSLTTKNIFVGNKIRNKKVGVTLIKIVDGDIHYRVDKGNRHITGVTVYGGDGKRIKSNNTFVNEKGQAMIVVRPYGVPAKIKFEYAVRYEKKVIEKMTFSVKE